MCLNYSKFPQEKQTLAHLYVITVYLDWNHFYFLFCYNKSWDFLLKKSSSINNFSSQSLELQHDHTSEFSISGCSDFYHTSNDFLCLLLMLVCCVCYLCWFAVFVTYAGLLCLLLMLACCVCLWLLTVCCVCCHGCFLQASMGAGTRCSCYALLGWPWPAVCHHSY